jgi:hypothetical protein
VWAPIRNIHTKYSETRINGTKVGIGDTDAHSTGANNLTSFLQGRKVGQNRPTHFFHIFFIKCTKYLVLAKCGALITNMADKKLQNA